MSNLKQLAIAAEMYAQDYDDHFPKAASWQKDLQPYLGQTTHILRCPSERPGGYGMNSALNGISFAAIENPASTILFYEVNDSKQQTFPHAGMQNVAFADGHVVSMRAEAITPDMWKPALKSVTRPKPPTAKKPASTAKPKASTTGKKRTKKKR